MRKLSVTLALIFIGSASFADDLSGLDRFLCSTSQVSVCFEDGDCIQFSTFEADVPQFVVVDTKKKLISTTKASGENRSTPIRSMERDDTTIFLQGLESGRAFSFVIDEGTGLLTAAVSRDGLTVSVFGACTDTDI